MFISFKINKAYICAGYFWTLFDEIKSEPFDQFQANEVENVRTFIGQTKRVTF